MPREAALFAPASGRLTGEGCCADRTFALAVGRWVFVRAVGLTYPDFTYARSGFPQGGIRAVGGRASEPVKGLPV